MLKKYHEDILAWNRLVEMKGWMKRYTPRRVLCELPSHTELVRYWRECGRERTFDAKWSEYIPHREWYEVDGTTTELCVVDRCFRLSKYQDMATVQRLFRGSKWALVDELMAGCEDPELRARAAGEVHRVRGLLGEEVGLRVVLGMRVDGSFVRWLLTDAVVSYLSNLIVTGALWAHEGQRDRSIAAWARILGRTTRAALNYVAVNTDWLMLGYV